MNSVPATSSVCIGIIDVDDETQDSIDWNKWGRRGSATALAISTIGLIGCITAGCYAVDYGQEYRSWCNLECSSGWFYAEFFSFVAATYFHIPHSYN